MSSAPPALMFGGTKGFTNCQCVLRAIHCFCGEGKLFDNIAFVFNTSHTFLWMGEIILKHYEINDSISIC